MQPGQQVSFDNLFTTHSLLDELFGTGIGGTVTIRDNRISKNANPIMMVPSKMNKMARGTISHACSGDQIVVRWKDNKTVSLASSVHGVEPVSNSSRRCKKESRSLSVPTPDAVKQYNISMGGVDLHDQFVASYCHRIRSKK